MSTSLARIKRIEQRIIAYKKLNHIQAVHVFDKLSWDIAPLIDALEGERSVTVRVRHGGTREARVQAGDIFIIDDLTD